MRSRAVFVSELKQPVNTTTLSLQAEGIILIADLKLDGIKCKISFLLVFVFRR